LTYILEVEYLIEETCVCALNLSISQHIKEQYSWSAQTRILHFVVFN